MRGTYLKCVPKFLCVLPLNGGKLVLNQGVVDVTKDGHKGFLVLNCEYEHVVG